MGILDLNNPQGMGLLSLGLRLMSTPGKFGTALGQAGMGALGDMQQIQAQNDTRKSRDLQQQMLMMQLEQAKALQEAQRVQAQRQAKDEGLMRSMLTGTPVDGMGPPSMTPQLDPGAFVAGGGSVQGLPAMLQLQQALGPKPADYKVVGGSLVKVGPEGVSEAYRAPTDNKPTAGIQEYEYAKTQGYRGTFADFKREMARAGAPNTSVSYGTPVAAIGPDGKPIFLQPSKDGSPPNIIPGVRPPMSPTEERAAADKAANEKRVQQVASIIEQSRALLESGTPTASGVGTMVDAGARVIGQTTPGAQASAQLQALGGWFVANVPRMEGPQSNFDVQNYMVMAGKIGDSTVPIQERLAALDTVEEIQRKYADINGTPLPEKPSGAKVRKYNPQTGKIE